MNHSSTGHQNVVELNIGPILMMILRKWWLVALSCAIFTGGTWAVSEYLLPREYTASGVFYVNNGAFSEDNRFSGSDMDASRSLAETYTIILTANQTLDAALRESGLEISLEDAADMIQANTVEQTELFRVTVRGGDPEQVGRLAGAIDVVFPERIREIMPGSKVQVVQPSAMPTKPSAPSPLRNAISGFLFGFVFACSALLLWSVFDMTIRREEDLSCVGQVPVLARIPEMKGTGAWVKPGSKARLEIPEAYKTLRTKLEFAADYPKGCRVIAVCSAMAGEGKSTTAVNLAHVLSQKGSRVLLVDCDLRRPSVHQKLSLKLRPGLSDHLARQMPVEELVQRGTSRKTRFDVICAGRVPPNPSELLSSPRLGKLLENLRQKYDVILLDLPPVGEVSDGIVVAKHTDGTVLVARRNVCDRQKLTAAVEQFASVKERILGIVFNCAKT